MGVVSSSENELLACFESGFEIGFEELLTRFETKLYSLCLGLTRNSAEAEAVLSTVFCRAFDQIDKLDKDEETITQWLFRAAIDESAELELKAHPEIERPETVILTVVPDSQISELPVSQSELIRIAIRNLPYEYRVVYLLHDASAFSVEETAGILELTQLETRAFLHRARLMICRHLRKFQALTLDPSNPAFTVLRGDVNLLGI